LFVNRIKENIFLMITLTLIQINKLFSVKSIRQINLQKKKKIFFFHL